MNIHRICILAFLLVATGLGFSVTARADVDPTLTQARADLEKAWNPAGDPLSNEDRAKLLQTVLKELKDLPPNVSGAAYRHIRQTQFYIKAALKELEKNDPDQKVTHILHDAVDEIRDIT